MHMREHRSLLAAAEKRLLIAIANRLPGWVTSDHLTVLGLLSMPLAGAGVAVIGTNGSAPPSATVACLPTRFGSRLAGTPARVRHRQRPRYGYYVDHVIDLT